MKDGKDSRGSVMLWARALPALAFVVVIISQAVALSSGEGDALNVVLLVLAGVFLVSSLAWTVRELRRR